MSRQSDTPPELSAESVCPAGPDGVHYFFSDDECAYCHKLDQIADTVAPLYESAYGAIYLGRAEDVLPTLPRASAHLLATDPPYGVGFRSNRGQNFAEIANDDGSLAWPHILRECLRVLREKRHLYVFGGLGFDDVRVAGRATLIWDKANIGMGDLSLPWGPQHEPIDFGVYVPRKAARAGGEGGLNARLRQGSILKVLRPNAASACRHPNEKPVALMRQLVEASSRIGETVLDPFLGSGATAVAAVLAGRRYVGVEVDPKYADMAVRRVIEAEQLASKADTA